MQNNNLNKTFTVLTELLAYYKADGKNGLHISKTNSLKGGYKNYKWRDILVYRFFTLNAEDRITTFKKIHKVSNTSMLDPEFVQLMQELEDILGFRYEYPEWLKLASLSQKQTQKEEEIYDFVTALLIITSKPLIIMIAEFISRLK